MERAMEAQLAARENVQQMKSYLADLNNWESEMKRKEAALRGDAQQDLPPVRSKLKKKNPTAKIASKPQPRIQSSDYSSWDSFDVDAACEAVDAEDIGPTSLDSSGSNQDKMIKLIEEAQHEKERGNAFVRQEKWDEALRCYNRAIELVNDNAIYFANRGLCHLKLDRLHQAESDCTAAIKLDPTYVKAYQRRAAAREKLGSLRAASADLNKVLELEPNNTASKRQLAAVKERIAKATKGGKCKQSPVTTPTNNNTINLAPSSKIIEDSPCKMEEISTKVYTAKQKPAASIGWCDGAGDDVEVIQPVQKPPHLRSKKPLRLVPIEEIELGDKEPRSKTASRTEPRKTATEIDKNAQAPEQNLNKPANNAPKDDRTAQNLEQNGFEQQSSPIESVKIFSDSSNKESHVDIHKLVAPTTCVQFNANWKRMKGNLEAKRAYLNLIPPSKLPEIFGNSLETDVLADIVHTLASAPRMFASVRGYLRALGSVPRFGALAMFLTPADKQAVSSLLQYCKETEMCSESDLNDIRNKFEL